MKPKGAPPLVSGSALSAERIERVYLCLTGKPTARGARAWFARQAKVKPWTVTRWLTGRRSSARGAAVLEQLEARAADVQTSLPLA